MLPSEATVRAAATAPTPGAAMRRPKPGDQVGQQNREQDRAARSDKVDSFGQVLPHGWITRLWGLLGKVHHKEGNQDKDKADPVQKKNSGDADDPEKDSRQGRAEDPGQVDDR